MFDKCVLVYMINADLFEIDFNIFTDIKILIITYVSKKHVHYI